MYIYIYYHSHPHLQPYSNNYHTYTYEAERWHTRPYTIITLSVTRYVSLMGLSVDKLYLFSDVTPWSRQFRILPSKLYRSIITAPHKASTVPSSNWAPDGSGWEIKTNWRKRRVTGTEDDYCPEYRTPPSQWPTSQTIDPGLKSRLHPWTRHSSADT